VARESTVTTGEDAAGPLPEPVRDWICGTIGPGSEIVRSRPLPDASTSAVHAVEIRGPGATTLAVVRRYVDSHVLVNEPRPVEREAAVLQHLVDTPVVAPGLLGADPTGAVCGVPTLLMTRLPGRPKWRAVDLDTFLAGLADQLPPIHGTSVPTEPSYPRYHPYYDDRDLTVPSWTANPSAWERAIEIRRAPLPEFAPACIHRDFHPGNVLWRRGAVSGVVDWAWSCIGPVAVDVAHCRVNLALHISCAAADSFLARCVERGVVERGEPAWDLIDAVDLLPDLEDSRAALARLDEFVARAASELS